MDRERREKTDRIFFKLLELSKKKNDGLMIITLQGKKHIVHLLEFYFRFKRGNKTERKISYYVDSKDIVTTVNLDIIENVEDVEECKGC